MTPDGKVTFDFETMPADQSYRLLVSTVVPRPIAWVTTITADGVVNAAPYSFFNALGSAPPVMAIGTLARTGSAKDTASNVIASRCFVVNLVPERLSEQMNLTCVDAPSDMSELDIAGLKAAPSLKVAAPRIAESPVSFECVLIEAVETGPAQHAILGRVVACHIAADALTGPEDRPRVATEAIGLIGRMHGSDWYARTSDLFQMPRPVWPPKG